VTTNVTRPPGEVAHYTPARWTDRSDGTEWELRSDGSVAQCGLRYLQCAAEFTATYGGRQVTIQRGERVVENHELAQRFVGRFRPAPSMRALLVRAAGEREADQRQELLRAIGALDEAPTRAAASKQPSRGYLQPAAKKRAPSLAGHLPPNGEIRFSGQTTGQRVTLRLDRRAYRLIADEVDHHAGLAECGGGVYGPLVRSWNSTVYAHSANELAEDKTLTSCRVRQADLEAHERRNARDETNNARLLGSWHSQPGANTKPSQEDLERWRGMLDRGRTTNGMRKQTHLIVTENRDGTWLKPTLTAWSMRQDESGTGVRTFVCEPADVVILQ